MSSITPLTAPVARQATAGRLVALTLGALSLGIAIGALCGTVSGILLYNTMIGDNSSGWDNLGDALFAFVAGVAVGGLAYLGASIAAIVRWVPAGQRVGPMTAVYVIPTVLMLPIIYTLGFG